MKVHCNYINENSLIDDMVEAVSNEIGYINLEMSKFSHNIRQLELEAFFEGTSISEHEVYLENEGIFTKIGNAVIAIVKRISDAIKTITDKFFGRKKDNRTDIEKVNSIIQQHPELRDSICEGIKKEWFTYKDVASYEQDIVQLVNMLQKGAMDHRTFRDKMRDRLNKFNESGKAILATGATVTGILLVIPKITGAYNKCKKSCDSVLSRLKSKFGKNKSDGQEVKEFCESANLTADAANAIAQEVSKALTAITVELNKINKSEEAAMNALRTNVISKYDTNKKEDDKNDD